MKPLVTIAFLGLLSLGIPIGKSVAQHVSVVQREEERAEIVREARLSAWDSLQPIAKENEKLELRLKSFECKANILMTSDHSATVSFVNSDGKMDMVGKVVLDSDGAWVSESYNK